MMIRYGGDGYKVHNQFGMTKKISYESDIKQALLKSGAVLALMAEYARGTKTNNFPPMNTPPLTQWVDYTGLGNNATLQGFAGTNLSGMDLVPLVNENGTPVSYENLVVNANLVDSSDGIADGWVSDFGIPTSPSALNGIQKFTPSAQYGQIKQVYNGTFSVGQRFYLRCMVKSTKSTVNCALQALSAQTQSGTTYHSGNGQFMLLSQLTTISNAVSSLSVRIRDDGTSGWAPIEFTEPELIRIDNNPYIQALESQLQRQLTAIECDRLFPFVATTGVSKISPRPMLKFDGSDDVGILANNASVDIVGTEEFVICCGFLTPSVLQAGFLICKNNDSAVYQYAIIINADSTIGIRLNSTAIVLTTALQPNTTYDLRIYKRGDKLIAKLQKVETYNQTNVLSLVSQPNLRIGARSSNVGGTTYLSYTNVYKAWDLIFRASKGNLDLVDGIVDKYSKYYR